MKNVPAPVSAEDAPTVDAASGSDHAPRFTSGRTLGAYRLIRLLGEGGFAEVWEAEHQDQGLHVALKVMHGGPEISPSAFERFAQEGRLAARLSHPRSLYVFSAEYLEGFPAITMELVHGGTLQDRLNREGHLPPQAAVDCILDVLEGLEAAERLGIVHRDIKPSNCFVDDSGRVKIGDFGISTSLGSSLGLTTAGSFLGTPIFSSPEQIRAQPLDARSDQYSVGATLYALLAGSPPFRSESWGDLMARILTETPPPLSSPGRKVPRGLELTVQRMLHKDPGQRFPTLAAARAALLPLSSQATVPARPLERIGAELVDFSAVVMLLISLNFILVTLGRLVNPASTARMSSDDWAMAIDRSSIWMFPLVLLLILLCEWRWQGTPGKRLLNLRIRDVLAGSPSLPQVLVRNAIFLGPMFAFDRMKSTTGDVLELLYLPAIFATMRAGNGFAGLHELASRTRVQRLLSNRRSLPLATPGASSTAPASAQIVTTAEATATYRLVRRLWQTTSQSLTLAKDDALQRDVWIFECAASHLEAPGEPVTVSSRPTRLRWLRGGRRGESRWNAYEAPSGMAFTELIRTQGRLSWEVVHGLIASLCDEIAALDAPIPCGRSLSIAHLWVDAHGQLRVLDFPWCEPVTMPEAIQPPSETGRMDLIRRAISLGLEGERPGADARTSPSRPQVPLPDSVSTLIDGLWSGSGVGRDPASFHSALDQLGVRKVAVQRLRRLVEIGITCAIPIFAVVVSIAMLLRPGHVSAALLLDYLSGDVELLAIGAVPAMLLAWAFPGGPLLRLLGMRVQTENGRPASRARCLLRSFWASAPTLAWLTPHCIGAVLLVASGTYARKYAESITWLEPGRSAFRGSILRFRHITLHAFLDWAHVRNIALDSFGVAMLLLLAAGGVAIALNPERGLHDRLARTRVVPR